MNRKLWLRILISLIGAAALAALIWFAAPLIVVQDAHPLEEPAPRFAAIALALALIAGAGALRLYRRRKGAGRIARGISVDDSDAPVLAERMKEALGVLRTRGRANYLYDLPWYLLIGPPGSGKTTALINSGLKFPLAGGATPDAVKGVGGTRYCDWWFTEDAVLIDTAGRYTTQDSDAKADQKSWLAFLDLLKRNRPRQPINGVLVAISIEDLLTLPQAEVAAHAAAIRARLIELHARLKVNFPVYALFTKADLIVGFMEFFGDLDEPQRAQVFGATFQTMDRGKSMLAQAPAEFDALALPLTRLARDRLGAEKNPVNRVLLFGFPAQMAALQAPVIGFLNAIFDPAHYKIKAALRGFYFTSGTQQGTPIDQLLGALAKGFGAEAVAAPPYSGQGKSFFLTDLIRKVIIGEAGWVSTGRGRRLARTAAHGCLLVAAPLLAGAGWLSYARNQERIRDSEEAAQKYAAESRGVGEANVVGDRDLSKVLPALHALRFLPGGYGDQGPEATPGDLGMTQTARLKSAANTAYGAGLERMLRPRLIYRLEEQIEADANDPSALFNALKVYLMLGGLKTADRQLLLDYMKRDWSDNLYPGPRNAEGREELAQHLSAMLDLETGRGPLVQLNGPLVEKAQAILARQSVATRALNSLAAKAMASGRPDWSAGKAGGANARAVFDPSIETIKIPWFLTKPGFADFTAAAPGVVSEAARDRWVLGAAGQTPEVSGQYDHLADNLGEAYAMAFVDAWRKAIGKLKMRRLTADRPTYPLLAAASSVTSPLIALLESIRDETLLAEPAPASAESTTDASAATAKTPAAIIDAALAPYHRLVDGDPGRRPIDQMLSQLNDIRANLSRLASNGAPAAELVPRIASGIANLRADAAGLPQPFARMMDDAGADIMREIADSNVAGALATLRQQVTLACQDKIAARYPFAKGAERDVAVDDFARMFGPKGLIDQFVGAYVLASVDASGPQWKWRDDSPLAGRLSPTSLADFALAADIRATFFSPGLTAPGFSYMVTAPAAAGSRLEIDSTVIAGRSGSTNLQWPGAGDNHRALLTLRPGGSPLVQASGAWALYHLLDAAKLSGDGALATFSSGARELAYRFTAAPATTGAVLKPLDLARLRNFHCPGGA
jgi:type VI secretion system protein ImpL